MSFNWTKHLSEHSILLDFSVDVEVSEEEHPNQILWKKKRAVLDKITDLLYASGNIKNRSKLFTDLYNREKKATTALERGFAIPHVRTMEAREFTVALMRCPEGVDFGALDENPTYLFLAMVAPPYDDKLYLRVYRSIAKGISENLMSELMEAESVGEVYRALRKY